MPCRGVWLDRGQLAELLGVARKDDAADPARKRERTSEAATPTESPLVSKVGAFGTMVTTTIGATSGDRASSTDRPVGGASCNIEEKEITCRIDTRLEVLRNAPGKTSATRFIGRRTNI
jgi:hypothetical protein